MFPELKILLMVFGKALSADVQFMDRLKDRLRLREVNSEDESDVIIAFVPISSRVGTEIESALKRIPQSSRPVVLVVLHHTFDTEFVTPNSSLTVSRENVFTVDCLFHEDKGFQRCLRNDKALKAVTEHLNSPEIFKQTSHQAELLPKENRGATGTCCIYSRTCIICTIIVVFLIIAGIVVTILNYLGVFKPK